MLRDEEVVTLRIAIVTFGSRGDVQPYVALGLGLKHAGHAVRVVTQRDCESLVREYGLDYGAVAGDVRAMMGSEVGQQSDLPDTVMMVESIPHSWLFPQMAAIVHHGGAGTTAASLRAGVPSLLIPFGMDQQFWARKVVELGVGPAPLPRGRLTASGLAQAILSAMDDQDMRSRAAKLGERICAEDGVSQAVEAFQRYCRLDIKH
jgi:UDP:flavonoid glycosyltransferase YjiC (YdhE family)